MTQKNIWKHVQVDSDRLKSNRYLNPSSPSPETEVTPPPAPKSISTGADYELLPVQTTYAIAVHVLRGACNVNSSAHPLFTRGNRSRIYRPLTFKETIKAKVEDYNTTHDKDGNERTLDERLRFFNKYIDSCTGMAYKTKSTEFQIILECEPLIEIARDFNEAFLPDSYASVKNGIKLNSSGKGKKYNQSLTKQEIENHQGWRTAVDDVALLRNYRDIVFSALAAKVISSNSIYLLGSRYWAKEIFYSTISPNRVSGVQSVRRKVTSFPTKDSCLSSLSGAGKTMIPLASVLPIILVLSFLLIPSTRTVTVFPDSPSSLFRFLLTSF